MRPATYESEEEAERLLEYFRGPTGQLQNTVFALVSPDGERTLSRTGRGPNFAFEDADAMTAELEAIAERYEPTDEADERSLPTLPDLRLALNVASCDSLPLVVGVLRHEEKASDRAKAKAAAELRAHLNALCYDEHAIGRAHYVIVEGDDGLREFEGFDAKADVLVLGPDAYGVEASVLTALHSEDDELVERAVESFDAYRPAQKDQRDHVRAARRAGIEWESQIPSTDARGGNRREE